MTLTNTQRIAVLEAWMKTHKGEHVTNPLHSHTAPATGPVYAFEDNFDGAALDLAKWGQNYKPSGLPRAQFDKALATVSGGQLRLRAERRADGLWYSSSIDTKLTFKQRYGIVEARIKVPKGRGLWPAGPWGYDDSSNGATGTGQEIDGMEVPQRGTADLNASALHCTVHYSGTAGDEDGGAIQTGIDLSLDFHVYRFEWRPGKIVWALDGLVVKTVTNARVPNVALPIILDLGVVGSSAEWPGLPDASTPSPSDMLVDWVRVRA